MSTWYVCGSEGQLGELERYARVVDPNAKVTAGSDALALRELLRTEARGGARVVVGEGARGPNPINVAAAVAADGRAASVDLVARCASGSLRAHAKRVGVTRVVMVVELEGFLASSSAPLAREAAGGATRAAPGACEHREGVPVICLVSGRGGVGKTSLCALMAHLASSWGMRVAAVDLDLAFGNLYALSGLGEPADLTPLADGDDWSAQALAACAGHAAQGLDVWGPCGRPEYAERVQPVAERLVASLTRNHELVLVDTTTNWGDAVAAAAQMADRLVIVSDERPGAVSALVRCGALAVRLGVARTRIVRLMNGCDARRRDETFIARAAVGLECAREVRVLDGGDEAVELLGQGHADELAASDNPLAASLACGLAQLLRELGCLPDSDRARRALDRAERRGRSLLGRLREAS